MKISGKFILKVAGTLTVISLVVAALLGLVNNVTADKIAEIDAANTRVAMSAVVPEGSDFTDKLEISDDVAAAAAAQGHGKAAVHLQCNGRAVHGHRGKDARIYLQRRYLSGGSVAAVHEPLCRQPAFRVSRAPHHQSLAVHGVPFR